MDRRKLGIAIACVLGGVLLFYLGGLVGQLLQGYDNWMASGGISGGTQMKPIISNPLYCLPFAFSQYGLKGFLTVIAASGAITLYVILHHKFNKGEYDERNFKRSKSGTYGTAGWMEDKELHTVLELSSAGKTNGVILGTKGSSVVSLPENTRLNRHIAVLGASGTGKSRGFVRPYLMQCVKRGESVIVTDPKNELYTDMAQYFKDNGYTVKVLNLVNPLQGDSWNCMARLNGDTMMAQVLTDVIISNTSEGKGDHFWDNGEGNLLKSLVLYVDKHGAFAPEEKNLSSVYSFLTQTGERQLNSIFDKLDVSHPAKAPFNLFRQASDTVRAGIILGLGTRLQVLQAEAVKQVTSFSDIDLTEPAKNKCAYFVILSDQDGSLDFLSSLFFAFLFIKLVRFADSCPGGMCPVPVNLALDEFNNIGSIPDFARRLSTIRSRDIRVSMIVQNLAQLQNRYPNNLWAELLGNCDTQIMLGCTDEVTADFISARTGDMTVEVNSTMVVKKAIAIAQMIPQYRFNESLGKRRLMTPDEVLRLPNDEILVMIRGQKVLKLKRFDYTAHPASKRLVKSSIAEYAPKRMHFHYAPPVIQEATPITSSLYSSSTPPQDF